MIKLNIIVAISIVISFPIFLVFIKWIFYNLTGSDKLDDKSTYLRVCPYCIFVFFKYDPINHTICPRCKSYIITEKEEQKANINNDKKEKIMPPKIIKNEKGVVFITVLMIIMVMMVLAISVISISVGQVMIAERQVKRLQAEMVASGALGKYFASQLNNSTPPLPYTQTIDGHDFSVNFTTTGTKLDIDVGY